ncbi:hypothetical protein DFH94DRAFT_845109 [Russula ochroleuca]|uniref:Uncharacterized protein n=1 Tax=Russula ochroleuca TaxID=152965 RepID=A0A9P5MUX6_9AGAM|nr:hypothetical protein DFH94DRAFT_845109 [Russula ochroleuca]
MTAKVRWESQTPNYQAYQAPSVFPGSSSPSGHPQFITLSSEAIAQTALGDSRPLARPAQNKKRARGEQGCYSTGQWRGHDGAFSLFHCQNSLGKRVGWREADRCSAQKRRPPTRRGASQISARETARPSHGRKWDTTLQGVTDIPSLLDPTGTTTYARTLHDNLPRLLPNRRAPRHLQGASRSHRQHRRARAQIWQRRHPAGGKEFAPRFARTAAELARTIQAARATRGAHSPIPTFETHEEVTALLFQDRFIDLVIPRGSKALVREIPDSVDGPRGRALRDIPGRVRGQRESDVYCGEIDYPAACNTTRTLLVHQARLRRSGPTWRMRCSQSPTNNSRPIATLLETHVLPAPPEAYTTEHLSLTLAVRTVPSLAADIAHINEHGSHHELRLEDHAGFTPAMEIVRTCVGVKTSEVQITDIHQSKVYNPMINNDDTKANHSVP